MTTPTTPIKCSYCGENENMGIRWEFDEICSSASKIWLPDGWELDKSDEYIPETKKRIFKFICPKCLFAKHNDPEFTRTILRKKALKERMRKAKEQLKKGNENATKN